MPDDALSITFEVSGQDVLQKALTASAKASDKAAAALEKQGKAVRSVTEDYQRLTSLNGRMVQGFNPGASGGTNRPLAAAPLFNGPSVPPMNAPTRPGKPKAFTSGPRQRLANLQEEYGRAVEAKDGDAEADIWGHIARARKQIAAEDKPKKTGDEMGQSFNKRFSTFLHSTRFNAGGASPLIGKTMDLLGAGTEAFAGKLTVATAALDLMARGTLSAAAAGARMGALNIQNGSSSSVSAALTSLNMTGDSAKGFNERITSDPMAMGYAARYGINNAPGSFGSQDWGAEELQAMRGVRSEKDPTERLRAARALGIDGPWLNLSDNTFNQMVGTDANQQGATFNKDFVEKSSELSVSADRLKQSFEGLSARLFGPAMNGLTTFNNEAKDIVNGKMTLKRFFSVEGTDEFGNATGGKDADDTTKNHTDAMKKHTEALGMGQRQYGHGERTDAAIPQLYGIGGGWYLRQALQAKAFRLGAFGG